MNIGIRTLRDSVILDIHSVEINSHGASILKSTINNLIRSNNVNILINMAIVENIDSVFPGYLLYLKRRILRKGGDIKLYAVRPDILMILYVIQLDKYINIYNNESDALNSENMLIKRRFKVV